MSRRENILCVSRMFYNVYNFLHFLQIIVGLSYRCLEMKRIVLILSNKYHFIYNEVPLIFIYERRFPSIFQNFVLSILIVPFFLYFFC